MGDGSSVSLTTEIGRGGEGAIYASPTDPLECAKIYLKPLSAEAQKKLTLMVANPPPDPTYKLRMHRSICWPTAVLHTSPAKAALAGFFMPKLDLKIFQKALLFIDPQDRTARFGGGFTWKHLVTAATNIASAVAAIHEQGYCIGDLNESNILIAPNALISLIDCDSFQVPDSAAGKTYRSPVGKPEYTAPELSGKRFSDVDRTFASDSFALAVLLFQLLMEGTHPYQARGRLVENAPSTESKILLGHFPYGVRGKDIAPPDHAPPFEMLHPEMQKLFERCFARGHRSPDQRPTPREWYSVLRNLDSTFRQCGANPNHLYFDHLRYCPWCEIEPRRGRDPFPSPVGQQVALDNSANLLDSLEKRLEYLHPYVVMAFADGILTSEEESQLSAFGKKLQIPPKEIEKLIQAEAANVHGQRGKAPGSPEIALSQTSFEFNNIRQGTTLNGRYTITNAGGGTLSGTIKANRPWVALSRSAIDGAHHIQEHTFDLDTSKLTLGTTNHATIEIASNAGTVGINVSVAVEIERTALSRWRKQVFWVGILLGLIFGLGIYNSIPPPYANAVTQVAGLVGAIALVVVCAVAGKWGGGIGGFFLAYLVLTVFRTTMPGYSAVAWAEIASAFLYFCARRLFVANLSGDRRTRAWVALSGVGLVAIVILSGLGISSNVRLGPIGLTNGAPEQIVDRGACPFEGCKYGERWMAKQNVDVYSAPPGIVGVSVSSLRKKATVHAGTWVRTETGVVLARRREGRVTVVNGRSPYGGTVKGGPPLKNGQVIPIYSYLGEGCWRSWIGGQFLVVCDVTSPGQAQNEWWIRIRTASGTEAWTNSAEKAFVSEEGLNSELGERILDTKLALPDKLAQIDALLRGGAGLNGSGGKYGTDPLEAAIRTKNVDLLRALVSKGLNIRKSQPCPAYWAAQNALAPGGDQMLEFLLENGMQLNCLTEPPLHAFLYFGIATDGYSPDRAIRIAEVLVKHGARVDQRDSQGKSIFDLLDQPKWASRVAALRDALANLAKHPLAKTILDVSPEQTTNVDSARPSPGSIPDQPISGAGFSGGAYRIGGGVSAPTVIHKVEPEYSEEARQRKFQGTVILFIVVDAEGKPRDLRVIRPLGLGLDQKAIEAVEKWKFKPGMKDGKPVAVQATIEVNFRLL